VGVLETVDDYYRNLQAHLIQVELWFLVSFLVERDLCSELIQLDLRFFVFFLG
jgi:hypothetical protein